MPMIDVYATEGTFQEKHSLAQGLAQAVMRWEEVPGIPLFLDNTAAFIHDLPADAISNAAGASNYVRVQVLTPTAVLDRAKQARDAETDLSLLLGWKRLAQRGACERPRLFDPRCLMQQHGGLNDQRTA
jgi:hypothetical protein